VHETLAQLILWFETLMTLKEPAEELPLCAGVTSENAPFFCEGCTESRYESTAFSTYPPHGFVSTRLLGNSR
jgi:hypothetical protein